MKLTAKDLEKIESHGAEGEGYWIYLKRGYCNAHDSNTHAFIEDTKAQAIKAFKAGVDVCQRDCCK